LILLPALLLRLLTACDVQVNSPGTERATVPAQADSRAEPALVLERATSSEGDGVQDPMRLRQPQDIVVQFERLSIEQGLSQSAVPCIIQDMRGFMWFCTQDGLNRYDGYDFAVYEHDPDDPASLANSFIHAIHQDPSGALWIGTNGGGLARLDPETGQFTRYVNDPQDPDSLGSDFILSLYTDRDGVLWIGTDGGGLNMLEAAAPGTGAHRFARYQNRIRDPHSLSDNAVQTVFEDSDGVLWVGTNAGGLNRLDREGTSAKGSERFVRYQHDPEDPLSLSHNDVRSIYQDREGALWIGTNGGGLDRFDRRGATDRGGEHFVHYQSVPGDPHSLSHDQVWSLLEDRSGALWIGTFGGGLNRFDRETGQFTHYRNDPVDPRSLSHDQILSIFEDDAGALWIGTFGGGVNRFEQDRTEFRHYQVDPNDTSSLSENMVWSIHEDDEGTLWIGTSGGGLDRLDRDTAAASDAGQFVHYRHAVTDTHSLSDDVVWSIHRDSQDELWIGTGAGLDRFDRDSGHFTHYPALPVFTIYEDQEGQLWIGTWGGGLGKLDEATGQFSFYTNDPTDPQSLSDSSVLSVFEDRDGTLWVGTFNGGLSRFHRDSERFDRFVSDPGEPSSLSNNTVLSIHQDREGTLWIATGGGGLNRFERATETFSHYTEKDGLPNATIYGILEEDIPDDGPVLWLSTNRGLSRFNARTLTFRNYDVGDGLQSGEFNQGAYHKSPGGEMFFGGVNGLNAFYPEHVRDNPHIPPIVLTALTQGGEDVAAGTMLESLSGVTFKWPRNFFEFEFAALDYSNPAENQYAYMLEGFDADWSEVDTRRFGRYTNLPGGTYTLRMKGSNNDGVWNEAGASLEVTVVPPFWRTWWFLGLVALVVVGGVIGGYALRVRNVEARSRELEAQVASRTRQLAALNAVTSAVSRSLDLQEILDAALDMTLQVTETEGGAVYLLEGTTGLLTIAAHRGFDPDYVSHIDALKLGEGFSGHVAQSWQPLVVEDVSTDERLTRFAAREQGFHSLVCVPLSSREKVLGTLFAVTRGFREFTDEDVELLTSISHQIGVALENARLYEDASTRLAQLTALQETTSAVASTLDLDMLLNLIIQQATNLLDADGGVVNLVSWERQEDRVVAAIGSAVPLLGQPSTLEGSLSGWVALHNEAVISNDIRTDSRVYQPALSWVEVGQIRSAALAPLTVKGQVVGTLVVMGKQEGKKEFSPPDLDLLVAFANQAATAIENAQLLEGERKRADELDALRTTLADITAELELSSLLQAIVERAAGLLDATGGEFGLYDETSQELRIAASHNLGEDYVGTRHRLGVGAMGRVAQTGESLIIEDYRSWEGALAEYGHVHATLATPLKVGGRLVGVFTTVTTDPERRFTAADLHLLDLFAQQAAIAIENARLYEQAQQLAVIGERQRLARDLHDSVTQALYGMTLYSEAAAEELSLSHLDTVAEYLGELQDTAREALAEMRLLIYELRPTLLAEEGLVAALQARLLAVEGRAGLETKFEVEVEDRLPPGLEEELFRIAQEALNNVLKHAHASTITLRLRHSPQQRRVFLEVTDDGIGFDAATARQGGGLGLIAMEERAAGLGGQFSVEKRLQGGTRVHVEVPT
jgi:signal transduction histidine kinase/ligand-binding sensor domain-containing protein